MSANRPLIPNVLADRYASVPMLELWTDEARVVRERRFWLSVLRSQIKHGHDAPAGAVADYEKVIDQVDLASIRRRELRLHHDVMARIEEFNALAGHELVHVGLTSRDVTENTEQAAIRDSLTLMHGRLVGTLARLDRLAREYRDLPVAGRSHNVPAQVTTLGKRFATAGEELLLGIEALEDLQARYPLRGIKGPMGTAADQLQVLGGDPAAVGALEADIAAELGFEHVFGSVGQVYPRSLDLAAVDALIRALAPLSSLATTIRLMAGNGQATEGFAKGQAGSSAMPHKMNARSCERVHGLYAVLGGSHAQLAAITGDQWYEGDVTCSVVRRVALPNAFFAADGLVQTMLAVLDSFGAYPAVITAELTTYLPFLASSKILMAAVAGGVGRETAHAAIKEHATAVAKAMRESGATTNNLVDRLAADDRLGLTAAELTSLIHAEPLSFAGLAREQVDTFHARAATVLEAHPEAAKYVPEAVL
ncbi:MAG TPA: adenylosuccinate lyase [Candidatus Saccharimonadia bacterium]|nr:adenylosuccinate lyase [Candidatus Saccharimonadia bacterium]